MSLPGTKVPAVFDVGQRKILNISLAQYLGLEAALAFDNQDKIDGTIKPIHIQLAKTCGLETAIALSQYEDALLEMHQAGSNLLLVDGQHWMPVEAVSQSDFYQTLASDEGYCLYREENGQSYFLVDNAYLAKCVNGDAKTRQCGPILKRLGLPRFFSHRGIDELEMLLWGIVETACRPVDWEAIDCIMPGGKRKREALQRLLQRGILAGDDDTGYRCYYYAGVEEQLERKGFADLCRCRE